ncbi:MAG TPA: hypothetical protein VND95_07340 [Stellaceae bacterium]|nr:hypothetical protein [Stellaceae bacterium]
MIKVGGVLIIALVLAVLGGCYYLAYGDFPPPTVHVEKVLPDARFAK